MDLARFTGTGAYGRAYQIMLERDAHADGSVDRVLASNMVRLCPETADYLYSTFTPLKIRYEPGSRPQLEAVLRSIGSGDPGPEQLLLSIIEFTSKLGEHAEQDLDKMRIGGSEEQIVARGSDWCTDVARVACVLCQIAGFPARIVNLFDLSHAYSGHVIVEAFRAGRWGALDSSTGVVYATSDGMPASVWALMNDGKLVEGHQGPRAVYTTPQQFQAAGIANYSCWEYGRYDYTISGLNEYCLSILEMSNKGWPGGLRWLCGEDGEV